MKEFQLFAAVEEGAGDTIGRRRDEVGGWLRGEMGGGTAC